MNSIIFFTGAIVWGMVCLFVLYLAGEALLAVINSISYHRWCYACAKTHGYAHTLKWLRLPWSLVKQAWRLLFHRTGTTRYFNESGEWNGVGNWKVFKAKGAD